MRSPADNRKLVGCARVRPLRTIYTARVGTARARLSARIIRARAFAHPTPHLHGIPQTNQTHSKDLVRLLFRFPVRARRAPWPLRAGGSTSRAEAECRFVRARAKCCLRAPPEARCDRRLPRPEARGSHRPDGPPLRGSD